MIIHYYKNNKNHIDRMEVLDYTNDFYTLLPLKNDDDKIIGFRAYHRVSKKKMTKESIITDLKLMSEYKRTGYSAYQIMGISKGFIKHVEETYQLTREEISQASQFNISNLKIKI